MTRLAALFVAAALAFACAACKSAPSEPPKASTGDYKGEHKIRFGEEPPPSESAPAKEGGDSKVLGWIAAPFENIVYLPWKLIGGGIKGGVDGVSAGFGKDASGNQRMPFIGAVFSPINLVFGLLTGAVEGVAIEPGLVGPDDSFGHAMSAPLKHPTSIWWY